MIAAQEAAAAAYTAAFRVERSAEAGERAVSEIESVGKSADSIDQQLCQIRQEMFDRSTAAAFGRLGRPSCPTDIPPYTFTLPKPPPKKE